MDNRSDKLKDMKICRFCLSDNVPLTSIYEVKKDTKQVPLPLQLMACIAIEVFPSDGMPQMICKFCRTQTTRAYTFKSMCKKSDDALKVYLATGSLVKPSISSFRRSLEMDMKIDNTKQNEQIMHQKKKIKKESEVITLNYSCTSSADGEGNDNNKDSNENSNEMMTNNSDQDEDNLDESNLDSNEHYDESDPLLSNVDYVPTECFPCPQCERSFPLKQLLDLHLKNHERERNFVCEECGKAFFTKYDLNKHLLTHNTNKPFSCVICNKQFSRESLLHRHEKIHNDAPKYLCNECDRTFLKAEELDAHTEKVHKKSRPYSCSICNKSFVFKQGLERHELTHSTIKPHKCNYCEASFNSPIKLTRHVTSHAGLRPYPCKICGRTFLLSHHLTRHMRSHYAGQTMDTSVIGQHKCDICSMSFKRKDSLINHSAIHSMVNLKCVICNTEFDNANKVKDHIATHLSDLPYPCEKCDYSFETQAQLEDHELKHAEMEYEEQIEQEVLEEERLKSVAPSDDQTDPENIHEEDEYVNEEEEEDDDIAEFTITTDSSNPELIRRSPRKRKLKEYSDYFKDEIISEEDPDENNEEIIIQESPGGLIQTNRRASDGIKVYTRKNLADSKSSINIDMASSSSSSSTPTTTSKLNQSLMTNHFMASNKELNKIPNREIFNMKIGDKTVTVQKLVLTKEQMKAMAREGKIEKKGNTLLFKKNPNLSLPDINLDVFNKSNLVTSTAKKDNEKKSETTDEPFRLDDTFECNPVETISI